MLMQFNVHDVVKIVASPNRQMESGNYVMDLNITNDIGQEIEFTFFSKAPLPLTIADIQKPLDKLVEL